MINYALEAFELSGLVRDFTALPRHDQLPKDYQVKLIADDGMAFNSSWIAGVLDDEAGHLCWPDEIGLECDPPLVGMRMQLEVVCRTIDGHKNTILTGELQLEAWDGIIDAIIGAPHTRDVVTALDPETHKLKATTIVNIPMHKIRDEASPASWNENPINIFICISIKAEPLEESAEGTPFGSPTATQMDASTLEFEAVVLPPPASPALFKQMDAKLQDSPSRNATGGVRSTPSGSFDAQSVASEDSEPAPELIESLKPVLNSVSSFRPFEDSGRPPSAPPVAPPPPPGPPAGPSARPPSRPASGTWAVGAPPPPPTPPPSVVVESPRGGSPRPPPPAAAPSPPPHAASAPPHAPLGPPHAPPPPAVPAPPPQVVSTLDPAPALARPPAPMRHQKSRASFVFVASHAEDTQGIAVQIPTGGSDFTHKPAAPAPAPASALNEGSVLSQVHKIEQHAVHAPAVPPPPAHGAVTHAHHHPPPHGPPHDHHPELLVASAAPLTRSAHFAPALTHVEASAPPAHAHAPTGVPTPPPPGAGSAGSGGDVARLEATIATLQAQLKSSTEEHAAATQALQNLLKESVHENVRLQSTISAIEAQKHELVQALAKKDEVLNEIHSKHDQEVKKIESENETKRAALQSKLASLEEELARKESTFAKQQMQCDMQTVQLKRLTSGTGGSGGGNGSGSNNITPTHGNLSGHASTSVPFSNRGEEQHTPGSFAGRGRERSGSDPAQFDSSPPHPSHTHYNPHNSSGSSLLGATPGDRIAQRRGSLLNRNNSIATGATFANTCTVATASASALVSDTSSAAMGSGAFNHNVVGNHLPLSTPTRSVPSPGPVLSPIDTKTGSAGVGSSCSDHAEGGTHSAVPFSSHTAPSTAPPALSADPSATSPGAHPTTPTAERPNIKVRSLSQTVAQLGNEHFNLQSLLTSEMGSKTPQERLRRANSINPALPATPMGGAVAGGAAGIAGAGAAVAGVAGVGSASEDHAPVASAAAHIDKRNMPTELPLPLPLPADEPLGPHASRPPSTGPSHPAPNTQLTSLHTAHGEVHPNPSSSANPSPSPNPILRASPITGSLLSSFSARKMSRDKPLTAEEMSNAAGLAAAVAMVGDRRALRAGADSHLDGSNVDSHMMPIHSHHPHSTHHNTHHSNNNNDNNSVGGYSISGYESGEDSRSVTSAMTRSPTTSLTGLPRRNASLLNNARFGIAEGRSLEDHPLIASSIRDLNSTLRFSPALHTSAGSLGNPHHPHSSNSNSTSNADLEEPSPAQKRVLQRMQDRRRSQAIDGSGGGGQQTPSTVHSDSTAAQDAAEAAEVVVKSKLPELIEPDSAAALLHSLHISASTSSATQGGAPSHGVTIQEPEGGHPERKASVLQARYGRARLSRTQSVYNEAAAAAAALQYGGGSGSNSRSGSPSMVHARASYSAGGGNLSPVDSSASSEAKGQDSPVNGASSNNINSREESGVFVPVHYLRRVHRQPPTLHTASGTASAGGCGEKKNNGVRSIKSRLYSNDQDDLSSDSDTEFYTNNTTNANTTDTVDTYLFFPLELTQRDYLRRVYDYIGEGIRTSVCALFQDIDAHTTSAHSANVSAHAPISHRHSTGGTPVHASANISSVGSVSSAISNLHVDTTNVLPTYHTIQSYECVDLLKLLSDNRTNFKLRPYICAAGTTVPSNDAYTELLRCVDSLLQVYHRDITGVNVSSTADTGELCDIGAVLGYAQTLLTALHNASRKLVRTASPHSTRSVHSQSLLHSNTSIGNPNSTTNTNTAALNHTATVEHQLLLMEDLYQQVLLHQQYKDERMVARGWNYTDTTATSNTTSNTIGTTYTNTANNTNANSGGNVEKLNTIDDLSRHLTTTSKLLSPLPLRPRTSSPHLIDEHGSANSSGAYLRRLSSPGTSHIGASAAMGGASFITLQSLDRSVLSVTPPLPFSEADTTTTTLLTSLFQRSEATVAHLLVGVLPSNIAVIELMVCFSEIHDLLKLYHEHHRKASHRDEAVYLREFAEILETQLNMDLSSIGAFRTSQQQQNAIRDGTSGSSGNSNSVGVVGVQNINTAFSPTGASTTTTNNTTTNNTNNANTNANNTKVAFSPTTPSNKHSLSSSIDHLQTLRSMSIDRGGGHSPVPLLLTPGPTLVDNSRKYSTKKGGAAVSSAMLDQIYIELDDMAQAIADKKNSVKNSTVGGGSSGIGVVAGKIPSGFGNNTIGANTTTSSGGETVQNTMLNKSIHNNSVFNLKSPSHTTNTNTTNATSAVKKESWGFGTTPIDAHNPTTTTSTSHSTPVVRIQSRVQSGKYLLEHMHSLVHSADELLAALEEQRALLVAQRNREYSDVDHELTHDRLRQFHAQEEHINSVIKELNTLSSNVKHKLSPLQLTQNEELNALLNSRGHMPELANRLYCISLTTMHAGHREHVSVSVATLLIRSKSAALVQSVYSAWPGLTITVAVPVSDTGSDAGTNTYNTNTSFNHTDLNASMQSLNYSVASTPTKGGNNANTGGTANTVISAGYKAPYSLDFSSPSKVLSPPSGRSYNPQSSPRYNPTTPGLHISTSLNNTLNTTLNTSTHTAVTHHTHSTAHMNTHNSHTPPVEYITQPTADLDLRTLDFSSTRSLRVLGFTLAQMRDSKCFDLKELLGAGFPLNEVKNLKSTLYVNITAKDLRLAGYSAHECLNVGFDVASLRAGGFDDYSLVKSGLFNTNQLRAVGCDIQRIALMSMFESLDGKHWRQKTNWGSATVSLDKWYGVHLDGAGHVWKIDLRGNGLKGKLPPALSLLTSLQHLDLYNNLVSGAIPAEYAALSAMKNIYLGGNPQMIVDRAALHAMLPGCRLRL